MGTIGFRKFNGGHAKPMSVRFWEKVDIRGEDDCWIWMASTNKDGYGCFRSGVAHRFSWLLAHGDPGQMYVLHKCDNPICVNPKHLFLGTQTDNMRDMVSKGRINDRNGENNPRAKLTKEDVLEIYRLYNSGLSSYKIAETYHVSQPTVGYIIRGKSWKELWSQTTHVR